MRRGLMEWNPEELPVATLSERTLRLQAAMRRENLDGMLFYTNLVRPSAVTYITGFTPYWSDGILLLPRSGEPVFATALSKRVANWIRSTNPVGEIVNTPKPGAAIGQRLSESSAKRVGILELDNFPSGLYDEVTNTAQGVFVSDAGALFGTARRTLDAVEHDLLLRANTIAVDALRQVDAASATDAGEVAGQVEKHARLSGAEEAYIAIAPDLDSDRRLIRISRAIPLGSRFAVRASVAYKGCWLRRTTTFVKDVGAGRGAFRANMWLDQITSAFGFLAPFSEQIQKEVGKLPGAELESWMVESCVGSYPLEVIDSSRSPGRQFPVTGSLAVLTLEMRVDGAPWVGTVPAMIGRTGRPEF